MASADALIYSANSSNRMKPFIIFVTVASSHLLHLLQESTMICAMGSCLKMLENWHELSLNRRRKLWMRFWSKYFLFCISKAPKYNEVCIIGLPYIKHVHQYFTLRNRISKVFMMSKFFFKYHCLPTGSILLLLTTPISCN